MYFSVGIEEGIESTETVQSHFKILDIRGGERENTVTKYYKTNEEQDG